MSDLDNFFTPPTAAKPRRRRGRGLARALKRQLVVYLPSGQQFRHLPKLMSWRERYLLLALAVIAAGATVALPISAYYHFTSPAADYGGSFTEGMVGAPKYINPLLAQTNDVDRDLSALIYAGLFKYDAQGQLAPGLASGYELSADGLTYTFHLRPGLVWQDGQPLTSTDVAFTVLTAQNPDYGSFQRINWSGVEVSQPNPQTVVFKLKNKYAQFPNNTTLGIMPKHLWENIKPNSFGLSELNLKPVGAGPYQFSRIRRDASGNIASFELTAFARYYAGPPYISRIGLAFYPNEDKMIEGFNQNALAGLSFVSAEKLPTLHFPGKLILRPLRLPRYFAVFFNQNQSPALADKSVRLALNYATDKTALLQQILAGQGSVVDSPLLPGIIAVPDSGLKYNFDPAKAKQLLDEAGWRYNEADKVREKAAPPLKRGAKNAPSAAVRLDLKISTSNWPELVQAADWLKTQWEALGAQVHVEVLALPELQQAIKERSYESLLFGEVLGLDPDPFSFWHSSQKKDPGLNLALYDNPAADKLLEDTRQTLDRTARLAKYADFQKLVVGDAPVVFLYSPYYLYGQPVAVHDGGGAVIAIPSDRFATVNQWYIKTKRTFKK